MRKFKLIKLYPGSPKLGTVLTPKVDRDNNNTDNFYWEGSWFNPNKFTEYWEEVIEPTFQIISFSSNRWSTGLAILSPDGHYSTDRCGWPLKEMLEVGFCVKSGDIKIHSVKRLSDGEVFTIGDKAKTITSEGSHNIRQFRIKQRCTGTDANGDYVYDGIDAMWVDWEENRGGNWLDSIEKVIQKDYEVIEIQLPDETVLTYEGQECIKRSDKLSSQATYELDKCISDPKVKIQSVKRLSDGEIFTVGDKIEFTRGDEVCVRTVTSIYAKEDRLVIQHEKGTITNETIGGIFEEITKCKKPIFTTEDGVDIFKGDSVYVVDDKVQLLDYRYINILSDGRVSGRKYFSTKAAAQDYVISNAKLISIEDFNNAIATQYGNHNIRRYLIKLIKGRLNLE
jgi:hypothetical protein